MELIKNNLEAMKTMLGEGAKAVKKVLNKK